jgi:hypothetical protein
MVHALREAQRVLKPGGLLIDLRPAIAHRQVGLRKGGRFYKLGTLHESFEEDRDANRAVSHALRQGYFTLESQTEFECNRVLDTVAEVRDWLSDFVDQGPLPGHTALLARVERAFNQGRARRWIVIKAPLGMRVLRRQGH